MLVSLFGRLARLLEPLISICLTWLNCFRQIRQPIIQKKETDLIDQVYPACQNISIDYGIIEKSENVYVLPSAFGWSDLGTWKSLYDVADKNEEQNVIIGENVELSSSEGNLVVSSKDKLVVLEGVQDLFVLDTEDALLICNKENEQEVKRIVNDVKSGHNGKFI